MIGMIHCDLTDRILLAEASVFPARMYHQEPETVEVQWELKTSLPSTSVAQMEKTFGINIFFSGVARSCIYSITLGILT